MNFVKLQKRVDTIVGLLIIMIPGMTAIIVGSAAGLLHKSGVIIKIFPVLIALSAIIIMVKGLRMFCTLGMITILAGLSIIIGIAIEAPVHIAWKLIILSTVAILAIMASILLFISLYNSLREIKKQSLKKE